jgi:hypothetical protein
VGRCTSCSWSLTQRWPSWGETGTWVLQLAAPVCQCTPTYLEYVQRGSELGLEKVVQDSRPRRVGVVIQQSSATATTAHSTVSVESVCQSSSVDLYDRRAFGHCGVCVWDFECRHPPSKPVNHHAHAPRDLRLLRKRMLTTATLQHLHAIACRLQGCAHWVARPQVQWPHAACALTLTDSERVVPPASGEYRVHAPADAAAASAKTDKSLTVVIVSTPPYSVEHCCSPAQRPCCQALRGELTGDAWRVGKPVFFQVENVKT